MEYVKPYNEYDVVLESQFFDNIKSIINDNKGDISKTFNKFKSYISNLDAHTKIKFVKYFMICMLSVYTLHQISSYSKSDDTVNDIKSEVVSDVKTVNKSFQKFLHAVGQSESSNRWSVKKGQYLGYFQLGKLAIKDIGLDYNKINQNNKFLKDKNLQVECFRKLLKKNKRYLNDYIKDYDSINFNGIHVTESGILMAAHLVGYKNVKRYFNSDGKVVAKDGNGVPLTVYLKKFSGYEIPHIEE
jgi:hypothetical protein